MWLICLLYSLTNEQTNVLSRGLSFAPTYHFDLYQTIINVNRFVRSLVVKKHFLNENQNVCHEPVIKNIAHNLVSSSFQEQITSRDLIQLEIES